MCVRAHVYARVRCRRQHPTWIKKASAPTKSRYQPPRQGHLSTTTTHPNPLSNAWMQQQWRQQRQQQCMEPTANLPKAEVMPKLTWNKTRSSLTPGKGKAPTAPAHKTTLTHKPTADTVGTTTTIPSRRRGTPILQTPVGSPLKVRRPSQCTVWPLLDRVLGREG